jgi:hypothetical protein
MAGLRSQRIGGDDEGSSATWVGPERGRGDALVQLAKAGEGKQTGQRAEQAHGPSR